MQVRACRTWPEAWFITRAAGWPARRPAGRPGVELPPLLWAGGSRTLLDTLYASRFENQASIT